jgi:hypothetical protein
MRKIFFILLLTFFSLEVKSQILYRDTKKIENSKKVVDLIIYEKGNNILFIFDFFDNDICLNKSDLIVKYKSGDIKTFKIRKLFLCEKEVIIFSIKKIEIYNIDMIRYLNRSEYIKYDFKLKN